MVEVCVKSNGITESKLNWEFWVEMDWIWWVNLNHKCLVDLETLSQMIAVVVESNPKTDSNRIKHSETNLIGNSK